MISAKQAYIYPVEGIVKGTVPKWVKGSLYRIGPAKYEFGSCKYNHLFDGMGMVQRYSFHDGRVLFNSQFVHSDTYMKNKIANRIVVSEFGTVAYPDPCQSIFKRFTVVFDNEITDNTNVCIYPIGDELFSATETNVIHRINPQDLSTMGSIRLNKVLSIDRATAHQHIDIDTGLVHLFGYINSPPGYALVTLPSIKKEESKELNDKYSLEQLLTNAKIVGKIDARWKFNPSYFHSFGITENYYILLESPLTISILEMMKSKINNLEIVKTIKWWPQEKTLIHIINKKTGKAIPNKYITDPLFTFHHINAYEENDHVVIDYCGYDDGTIITDVYKDKMNNESKWFSRPKRLVVPLNVDPKVEENENLIKLTGTTAIAKIILKSNQNMTIFCSQEELAIKTCFELPAINYNVYNGRKYRYIYGKQSNKLIKIDIVKKETIIWSSDIPNGEVGEPTFLRDPVADSNNPEDEDLGVLLTPVIYIDEDGETERYQSLFIINAKTMKEMAQAEFKTVSIPLTFHGVFLNNEGHFH